MIEYCVCGHPLITHTHELGYCQKTYTYECTCGRFKLDNLKYVEDLAKKRNLI